MNFHGPSNSGLSQIGVLVRFLRGAIAAERIRVESVPSSMPRRSLNRADSASSVRPHTFGLGTFRDTVMAHCCSPGNMIPPPGGTLLFIDRSFPVYARVVL